MKRKVLALICALIMLVGIISSTPMNVVAVENTPVIINFQNRQLEFLLPDSIVEQDGQILASIEELAAQTGWKVDTYSAANPEYIKLKNDILDLTVEANTGENKIYINGVERDISASPQLMNNVFMFPVVSFFHAMNCSVIFDEESNAISANLPLARVFTDKEVVAKKTSTVPVIDGISNDVVWAGVEEISDFSTIFYNETPQAETNFKVIYNEDALYLFIDCEGTPVPLEGISVALAPSDVIGPDTAYYNVLLIPQPDNNLGRNGGLKVSYRTSNQHLLKEFEAEYEIKNNSWSAEVKIPFASLVSAEDGTSPTANDASEWKLNISRIRPFTEAISSWAPLRYSFYQDLPTGDISYQVDIAFAATTNRTGSIFFGKYPTTRVFDNTDRPYTMVTPVDAGMLYKSTTTKIFFFDKRSLGTNDARFFSEWVNELGEKYTATIQKVFEKGSIIYFLVEHPKMINEGLYRFNLYVDEGNKAPIKRYEMLFDKQEVMNAGVKYTSFAVNPAPTSKTTLKDIQKSPAVEKLISIIPQVIGFRFTGNPDRPADKADSLYVYDYVNSPNSIVAKLAGTSGLKTIVDKLTGTTPSIYANNKSLTVTTKTGKEVVYNYYEDADGKQYFLDQHIDYMAKDALRTQIKSLAATDPVGTAYVLYEIAKAYQDWLPSADYYWRNYPTQWNWGPPYHYYGGMWNRWYTAELASMKEIVDAYGTIKNTNALDIVSAQVGVNVENLLIEGMFKPVLEYTKTYPVLNHNMEYNNWLGRIALSKATGDPDYVHETIDLVDYYASSQFMLDGFWKEISVSYHSQSLNGLTATIAALKGWSDPNGYISPRTGQNIQNLDMDAKYPALKAANLMTSTVIYPNGRFFPIQETWANDVTAAKPESRNLGSILLPAANIARMSKGIGEATNQLYLTYASKYGHNQNDPLNLALYGKGQELLPDLGYTHTLYRQWTVSTMSHNTVVVDSKDSSVYDEAKYGGKVETYADLDETVQIMKADQENAYPGLEEYDREPWYIKMEGSDDSYILDIFRVDGGSRHEYTLNGDANSDTSSFTANTELTDYSTHLLPPGTQVTLPTGETEKGSAEGHYYGYLYIEDVKKADLADGKYEITMSSKDGMTDKAGMKITGFAGENSELFVGKAPSLRPLRTGPKGTNNDKNEVVSGWYMPKLVVRRDGTDLQSTFVNVIEPYAANSSAKITGIEKLETLNPEDVAMKITYGNTTDMLLSSSNPSAPLTVGDITFEGKMAFIRYIDGQVAKVYTVEASSLNINGNAIAVNDNFAGKVLGTMRKAIGDDMNAFIVSGQVDSSTVGNTMTITHPDGSVHAFEVACVKPQGTDTIVEVKDMDPGFEILKDGSSELRFFPLTKWTGDHTYNISGETIIVN